MGYKLKSFYPIFLFYFIKSGSEHKILEKDILKSKGRGIPRLTDDVRKGSWNPTNHCSSCLSMLIQKYISLKKINWLIPY